MVPLTVTAVVFQQYSNIKKQTRHMTAVPDPSYIFEVVYGDMSEQRFQTLRSGRRLMLAYHGSRVENFHSILHNGLASHMNKVLGCSSRSLVDRCL